MTDVITKGKSTLPTPVSANAPLTRVLIPALRVALSTCTRAELLACVENAQRKQRKMLVDNINMDILWYAQRNPLYRWVLNNRADVVLVDGVPVCWLASLAGVHVPERQALTDVVPDLMKLATDREFTVFILGSNSETLAQAKKCLREHQMLPHTVACWTEPRRKLENPDTNADVIKMIHQVQPDILFVALGSPYQTLWVHRNWEDLPPCTIVPVGGAFDYIAGSVGRAPTWMQKTGMEWLYRLLFDHQKRERSLFERYILTDLPFAFKLAIQIRTSPRRNVIQTSFTPGSA